MSNSWGRQTKLATLNKDVACQNIIYFKSDTWWSLLIRPRNGIGRQGCFVGSIIIPTCYSVLNIRPPITVSRVVFMGTNQFSEFQWSSHSQSFAPHCPPMQTETVYKLVWFWKYAMCHFVDGSNSRPICNYRILIWCSFVKSYLGNFRIAVMFSGR